MKRIIIAAFLIFAMLSAGCAPKPDHVKPGRFLPENVYTDKVLGLYLREDGTFYLNCNLSYKFHPSGTYSINKGVLKCVDENNVVIALFEMESEDRLVYVRDGSQYDATIVGDNQDQSFKISDGLVFTWVDNED